MHEIVIVYHSGYGHTRKVAEAVAQGSGGELLPIDVGRANAPPLWLRVRENRAVPGY